MLQLCQCRFSCSSCQAPFTSFSFALYILLIQSGHSRTSLQRAGLIASREEHNDGDFHCAHTIQHNRMFGNERLGAIPVQVSQFWNRTTIGIPVASSTRAFGIASEAGRGSGTIYTRLVSGIGIVSGVAGEHWSRTSTDQFDDRPALPLISGAAID